jgi:hypothetical protein
MSQPLDLHNQATEKAFFAHQAKLRNDFVEYLQLSKEAFLLEKTASMILKDEIDTEPTRSVLFRSAATLALNCGEYDEAIRLISHALIGNPHDEIRSELLEVLQNVSKERENSLVLENEENAYLEFLRDKAINIKIEPKIKFHSRAITVDAIVDTLKNFKSSIGNFIEVNFKRDFAESDFNDYSTVLQLVKKDYNPLCVNLSFKSFSASICVDDKIMSKDYSDKIVKWKENLFETYKNEVIDIEYEPGESINKVIKKYSPEERNLIYNPIIDSVKDKNNYRVSITDKAFKFIEKTFKPIGKDVQEILTPKITRPEQPAAKVLVQSYALAEDSKSFTKKDVFESHEMEYAEFSKTVSEVSADKEYLVVRNSFEVKIIYRRPDFIIEDDTFSIYTRAQTFQEIVRSYNKILIQLFRNYSSQDDRNLSVDEVKIKENLLATFMFTSQTE